MARDEDATQSENIERHELKPRTLEAITALAPPQREVVILFYLREYSHWEIAEFLGIASSQVNNRLHAARRLLKRRLIEMKLVHIHIPTFASLGVIVLVLGGSVLLSLLRPQPEKHVP